MDLNEKIAQRRRELENELEIEKLRIEKNEAIKKEYVIQEARKQLSSSGFDSIFEEELNKDIQREKDKMIEKLAKTRWRQTDKLTLYVLLVATIGSFFVKWWLGIILLVAGLKYAHDKTEQYKKEIINKLNIVDE